jgi:hypothetical protein
MKDSKKIRKWIKYISADEWWQMSLCKVLRMTWPDTLILKPRLSVWRLFIQQWRNPTSPLIPDQATSYLHIPSTFLRRWLANLNSLYPRIYLIHHGHQMHAYENNRVWNKCRDIWTLSYFLIYISNAFGFLDR